MSGSRSESGLSMVEIMLSVSVLAVTFISLGGAVMTGVKTTIDMEERNVVRNQAVRYMERLHRLSFGEATDTAPSSTNMDKLFDDTVQAPDVSLSAIQTPADDDGHQFQIAGFETEGTWEVRVNTDVNGNGTTDGKESANDLLKVEIYFEGRPVLTTFRAKPAQSQ